MDGASLQLPAVRSLDDLEAEITELTGHLNAAQHRWLTLIAEFDRRNGWSDGACASCAHWLNFKCGVALGAAREKVRVARALENLPKISAEMARGALSYSKVRALTRIADAGTEDYLLSIALHGTAHHVEMSSRAGPQLPRQHRDGNVPINRTTAVTRWRGGEWTMALRWMCCSRRRNAFPQKR